MERNIKIFLRLVRGTEDGLVNLKEFFFSLQNQLTAHENTCCLSTVWIENPIICDCVLHKVGLRTDYTLSINLVFQVTSVQAVLECLKMLICVMKMYSVTIVGEIIFVTSPHFVGALKQCIFMIYSL